MVEQAAVDVALPCEIRPEREGVARLIYLRQESHAIREKGSILQLYRRLSYKAWVPVRQPQREQDLA